MTAQQHERVPELTLGWRLKMALGDMKRDDMAEALGVNPATVSRWMADRGAQPKRAYLIQWALITGTSQEWLLHGVIPDAGPDDDPRDSAGNERLAALTARKRGRGGVSGTHRYPSAA